VASLLCSLVKFLRSSVCVGLQLTILQASSLICVMINRHNTGWTRLLIKTKMMVLSMPVVMHGVALMEWTNWRQKGKMVARKRAVMKISLSVQFLSWFVG